MGMRNRIQHWLGIKEIVAELAAIKRQLAIKNELLSDIARMVDVKDMHEPSTTLTTTRTTNPWVG